MTDLFQEVEEQLRSDRYKGLALKALPWVLGLAAALVVGVLGVWGWQQYRDQAAAKASDQYSAGLEALVEGRRDQAEKLWAEAAKSPSKAYRSLALMQLGGLKLADNRTAEAVKLFDEAAQAAPDAILGDAARLKSAFAVLDTAPRKEVETRLTPLMQDGRPYRVQAREALGFAKLLAGDNAGARSEFVLISQSLDAQDSARQRAKAVMDLIDSGSAKSIPAVAKAAAALPAPTMLAPGQATPAPPQPSAPGPQ